MDLTRFALPVTILEKRSLLEMYAEFFAHPDILTRYCTLYKELVLFFTSVILYDIELLTLVTPKRGWLK